MRETYAICISLSTPNSVVSSLRFRDVSQSSNALERGPCKAFQNTLDRTLEPRDSSTTQFLRKKTSAQFLIAGLLFGTLRETARRHRSEVARRRSVQRRVRAYFFPTRDAYASLHQRSETRAQRSARSCVRARTFFSLSSSHFFISKRSPSPSSESGPGTHCSELLAALRAAPRRRRRLSKFPKKSHRVARVFYACVCVCVCVCSRARPLVCVRRELWSVPPRQPQLTADSSSASMERLQ